MASLDQLSEALTALGQQLERRQAELAEAEAQTDDNLAAIGALLVPRHAWWNPPAEFHPWLMEADRLAMRIEQLDQQIARAGTDVQPRAGITPFRFVARIAGRDPVHQRAKAAQQLRRILVEIARRAIGTVPAVAEVPDAGILVTQVFDHQSHSARLRAVCSASESQLLAMSKEFQTRHAAARQLGFDALYLAAAFKAEGMPAVETPALMEGDEVACLSVAALLSHGAVAMRRPGHTPPVAHTGVRFWLGAFRAGSAPSAAHVDTGTLTVTNRCLHFSGRSQAFATPLDNVVEVDVYTDALVVTTLGRDAADTYRVEAPRQVAFYLNWALETGSR